MGTALAWSKPRVEAGATLLDKAEVEARREGDRIDQVRVVRVSISSGNRRMPPTIQTREKQNSSLLGKQPNMRAFTNSRAEPDIPTRSAVMASRQATLEYLTTTKIGEKGQLIVPKQFRKDLGLSTGAPFAVLRLGDGLVLLPQQQRFERLCKQIGSALARAGLAPKTILATLPEARQRVFARRYKKSVRSTKAPRRQAREQRGK